jgi:glycosyltransferase involved in cell wall biosynthesis
VIASNYSGNLDFTTQENALLVDTPRVPVLRGEYSWSEGLDWGNPDVDAAARAMTSIKRDAELRSRLATAGQRTVGEMFNPDEVGRKYRLVLERIFEEGASMKSSEGRK